MVQVGCLFLIKTILIVTIVQAKGQKDSDEGVDQHSNTLKLLSANREVLERQNNTHYSDFHNFIVKYAKAYKNIDEIRQRFENFISSIDRIPNIEAQNPHARFGITQFADYSKEEFIQKFTSGPGLSQWLEQRRQNKKDSDYLYIPPKPSEKHNQTILGAGEQWDWRVKRVVAPVKDQGPCGSCYAFASAAVVESQMAIKKNVFEELSAQEIVSCLGYGCNGGFPLAVFDYIIQEGVSSWDDYGYVSGRGYIPPCEQGHRKVGFISNHQQLRRYDEENMMRVVKEVGPIVTCLDGDPLQFYESGIISQGSDEANHAVVTVGYGGSNPPYWIIKNSYGMRFGEDGYFRAERYVNALNLGHENDAAYA